MKRVDVVIPCYKYAHYLSGCVRSVLDQDGVEVRILILDDASPDNTPEVAGELTRQNSRIEYRRHAVNLRHIDTYNEGLLEWASADYCMLLSADDLLAPGALGRAVNVMEANPEVGLTHGRQVSFDTVPHTTEAPAEDAPVTVTSGVAFIESSCDTAGNPVATPTAILRTELQHRVGGYRKTLPHTADMEMWLRCAAREDVAYIDCVQALKRRHQNSMQLQYLGSALGDLKERYETFESFFREDGSLLTERPRLHALATRRIAEQAFWGASHAFERGDDAGCQQCLELSSQLAPELANEPDWKRFVWKRRIGRGAWNLLQPLVDRIRGRKTPAHADLSK